MKVIIPVPITPAALLASSIAEDDHAPWSNATTYAADARCIHDHHVWISAQAGNLNHEPGTDEAWWVDDGPTNRWRMFDDSPGTTSTGAGSISVTLRPGAWVNAVALIGAVCRTARLQVLAADGTTVLFDQTQELTNLYRSSFHAWFMRDRFELPDDVVFDGLPRRVTGSIVVTLTGPGTVSLGVLKAGLQHDFGTTLAESETDPVSHSRVLVDEFGGVTVRRRGSSRQLRIPLYIDNADLPRVLALRAAIDGLPCVFSGADSRRMRSALLAYGLATRMPISVKGVQHSTATLEVQGYK